MIRARISVIFVFSDVSDDVIMAAVGVVIEPRFSNNDIKEACRQLHDVIVKNLNSAYLGDYLFARRVLSEDDMHELELISHKFDRCRHMLMLLHRSHNDDAFLHLFAGLQKDDTYRWLSEQIQNLMCETDQWKERSMQQPPQPMSNCIVLNGNYSSYA